ncbi:copper amine oxidase N-terminal domain-containing protein [Brevibacillus daliensis]|uniref:copper amine oxidase N-terminal domain-containing protein n=1 Tax=Brevibacillus daliensis TaxID=2892995 RepID=UPI001E47C219|nr:copper amine oxidase N-terminal domain-containing protein [Brevibacillus daliensis]
MKKRKENALKFSQKMLVSIIALATTFLLGMPTFVPFSDKAAAHGGEAEYVPLRTVIENVGGTLEWDKTTKSILVKKDGTIVYVTPNSAEALVNGKTVKRSSCDE